MQSGSFLVTRPLARSPRSLPDVCGGLLALPPGPQLSPLRGPLGLPGRGGIQLQKRITGCQIIAPNSISRDLLFRGLARPDVRGRLRLPSSHFIPRNTCFPFIDNPCPKHSQFNRTLAHTSAGTASARCWLRQRFWYSIFNIYYSTLPGHWLPQ